jgi:ferredoxin
MTHKITVDQSKCIGCGACSATCPGSFEMTDGKANAKKAEVEKLTCEKDAEAGCPVNAISVS